MKESLESSIGDKMADSDKQEAIAAVKKELNWLEESEFASKDEYEAHYNDLEGQIKPLMSAAYDGRGHPDDHSDSDSPDISEVE